MKKIRLCHGMISLLMAFFFPNMLCGSANASPRWTPSSGGIGRNLNVSESNLYAMRGNRIYISPDHGATWAPTGPVIPDSMIPPNDLKVIGSNFYICGKGVLRASASESLWSAKNVGFVDPDVYTVNAIGKMVLAGTTRGIYASNDSGEHWTSISGGVLDTVIIPRISMVGTTLFVATNRGDSFRGVPDKTSYAWTEEIMRAPFSVISKGPYYFSASLTIPSGTTNPRINRSLDSGKTWTGTESGIPTRAITMGLISMGGDLFVMVNSYSFADSLKARVLRSSDDGAHWTPADTGLPIGTAPLEMVALGSDLFLSTVNHGIWKLPTASTGLQRKERDNSLRQGMRGFRIQGPEAFVECTFTEPESFRMELYSIDGVRIEVLARGQAFPGTRTLRFPWRSRAGKYLLRVQSKGIHDSMVLPLAL